MQINNLLKVRYSITNLVSGGQALAKYGGGVLKASQMPQYTKLVEKHISALRLQTRATSQHQVIRNHLTALRAFLKEVNKSEESAIGSEFNTEFERLVNQHLKNSALSDRSKSDRKSLLKSWKSTFDSLELQDEGERVGPIARNSAVLSPFQSALQRALKASRLSAPAAATKAGISAYTVRHWVRGGLPNKKSAAIIHKLEAALELAPGGLSSHFQEDVQPVRANAYRERLRKSTASRYRIQPREVQPEFIEEWKQFLEYKTATRPRDGRKRTGAWTASQARHSAAQATWINTVGNGICHTAGKVWADVSSFLGFVQLASAQGGYGRSRSEAMTLAWLCVPEAVDAFLNFMTDRCDGLKHEGHRSFCRLVKNLAREKYGYLRQRPELIARLPDDITNSRTWDGLCNDVVSAAVDWHSAATDTSRDPNEAISWFLEKEQPLKPVFEAMRLLRLASERCTPGSKAEAVFRRDELLLGLLVFNPLRAKNIKILTWKPDNSGHIYRNAAGEWRLRIELREFKTRGSKKRKKPYDVAIARWLTATLEAYVQNYREKLLPTGTRSTYLFPSSRHGGLMTTLNTRVSEVTAKFIPGCGGVGPHAFRHLVATVWLQEHTNDFLTVAELLNDSLQVVLSNYSHLKKDVSFRRYESFVASML